MAAAMATAAELLHLQLIAHRVEALGLRPASEGLLLCLPPVVLGTCIHMRVF